MYHRIARFLAIPVVMLLTLAGALSTDVTAQEEGGFPLGALAAYCQPDYGYPFTDCSPWDGLTVAFESADGTFSQTCMTANSGGTTSGCGIDAPFGSTISASIDPSSIPSGYYLKGDATQTFEIPNGPPQGQFAGPVFVLLPTIEETPESGFPLGALAAYCDPGYDYPFVDCSPWDGTTITFAASDGSFSDTCTTSNQGGTTSGCSVEVPFGSTIVASIDPAQIPDGYTVEGELTQRFEIPDGPPQGEFAGPVFVLLPDDIDHPTPIVDAPTVALSANAAYCEPGYLGPFVGCTPWNDVVVTFTSADGLFSESCTTSGTAGSRVASCTVNVPVLATVTASIDPATIPDGYVLEGDASESLDIPDGPLEGQLNNPSFVLLPEDAADEVTGDDTEIVTQLPVTGSGDALEPEALSPVIAMLIAATIIGTAGTITARRMQ